MTKPQNYSKPIDKYKHVCYNLIIIIVTKNESSI